MTAPIGTSTVTLTTQQELCFTVTNDSARSFGMSINGRNVVCNLSPDGLAYEAGVRIGDAVMLFDGESVTDEESLFASMLVKGHGQKVSFMVTRKQNEAALDNVV